MNDATVSLQLVLPERSEDALSEGLRLLTRHLTSGGHAYGYGVDFENDVFLMFPYYWGDCTCGAEDKAWEWEQAHAHGSGCYQTKVANNLRGAGWTTAEGFSDPVYVNAPRNLSYETKKKIEDRVREKWCRYFGLPYPQGCAVHCTCGHDDEYRAYVDANPHAADCPTIRPNFLHKSSGLRVDWYKYIGRGMEISGPEHFDVATIIGECIASTPTGDQQIPETE